MNHAVTDAKIRMLKSSLTCFAYGLLGLLPLVSLPFAMMALASRGPLFFEFVFLCSLPMVGLPFALAALWISGRVRVQEKQFWNAAKPYRVWGTVCAALGAVVGSGVLILVVARALMVAQGLG
jgi:hypothetical protein